MLVDVPGLSGGRRLPISCRACAIDSYGFGGAERAETLGRSTFSAVMEPHGSGDDHRRALGGENEMQIQVGDEGPGVTVTLDFLTVSLLLSSVLYLFCLILAKRKLAFLTRVSGPELSTKKLLVLSVGLVCAIRIMSFIGVAAMDIANVRAHYSLKPTSTTDRQEQGGSSTARMDRNQKFYDAAFTVMFDLPNVVVVSTFVLLTLVWAECFLQSRFHTESAAKWKMRWLTGYMLFNALLYGTQIILYILVILPITAKVVRTVLYALSTSINFAAVILVLGLYIFLSVSFSGFPFRSVHLKESLRKISNVMALWSLSRVVWGSAMLVIYVENVELLQDSKTPVLSAVVLFFLFLFCEIIPIVVMLDYSYMNMVGFESGASRDMNALASGQNPMPAEVETSGGDAVRHGSWEEDAGTGDLHGDLYGIYVAAPDDEPAGPLLPDEL